MCGVLIDYDTSKVDKTAQHKTFGIVHYPECFREAEMKYAKLILGKREDDPTILTGNNHASQS
jgi:hypothetical protein